MQDDNDALLTSRQVAQILDVSPDTVNEYARRSELPGVKRGRQWRFRRHDVASFQQQARDLSAA